MIKMSRITHLIDLRNTLLVTLVFLIVAIFGFWLPNQGTQGNSGHANTSGHAAVKVEYTEHGFKPQTITVPVGTTVAWSSPSGKPMWVASDPHPSHTDLKGFDQKGVITRATPFFVGTADAHGTGVYEYTFMKVGTWKYHNHVYPQHRGTVIVVYLK
jgi:plastocyanin